MATYVEAMSAAAPTRRKYDGDGESRGHCHSARDDSNKLPGRAESRGVNRARERDCVRNRYRAGRGARTAQLHLNRRDEYTG